MEEEKKAITTPEISILPQELQVSSDFFIRNEILQLARELIKDEKLEKFVENSFLEWLTIKDLRLTFLTEQDVVALEREFESYLCRILRSIPPSQQTHEVMLKIDALRILFKTLIRRSLGSQRTVLNERYLLTAIIKHITMPEEEEKSFLEKVRGK